MDKEYIAVELTDEELAKVVGGFKSPDNGIPHEECETCMPSSTLYLDCIYRKTGSSSCKYNQ